MGWTVDVPSSMYLLCVCHSMVTYFEDEKQCMSDERARDMETQCFIAWHAVAKSFPQNFHTHKVSRRFGVHSVVRTVAKQ